MLGKVIKFIIAILIIPLVVSATKAFIESIGNFGYFNTSLCLLLASGFFTYLVFHVVVAKPMYIYAWGHEIVHALATWLCGGRVVSFHVSAAGGNVTTTKSNLFITLSPYFVPIHAIFLALGYWALSKFYNLGGFSEEFVFLIGFTMSFHIFMTIEVLKVKQPDILKTGYFFSIFSIYVTNLFIAALFLSLIFENISFKVFYNSTFVYSKNIYARAYGQLVH
jgi:hypothetical protein